MDISLFYETRGTGFPLILLHGNGEDHRYFAAQLANAEAIGAACEAQKGEGIAE